MHELFYLYYCTNLIPFSLYPFGLRLCFINVNTGEGLFGNVYESDIKGIVGKSKNFLGHLTFGCIVMSFINIQCVLFVCKYFFSYCNWFSV